MFSAGQAHRDILVCVATLTLAACATGDQALHPKLSDPAKGAVVQGKDGRTRTPPEGDMKWISLTEPAKPIDGSGSVIWNFEGADLRAVVHSLLGETLGVRYTIDQSVQGRVTERHAESIPRTEVLASVARMLRAKCATMVREHGTYKIAPIGRGHLFVRWNQKISELRSQFRERIRSEDQKTVL
jgi:type II secretory pathway component GspD/PulD (secretin)